ncbi:MAG: hypothetical protein N2484_12920 [Clostridia bacterium]|nr:hypothetical protein [Clostridia bacterium]
MYRVFCESYENYLRQYDGLIQKNEFRYNVIKPFGLIHNVEQYKLEQLQETLLYKQLSDLLFYMTCNLDRYPKMRAFLWTLEARNIKGKYYGVVKKSDLEEQTKLANMFLNLLYWDELAQQF